MYYYTSCDINVYNYFLIYSENTLVNEEYCVNRMLQLVK